MEIKVIREDITKLEVDAIVNAANKSLLGGGGVDGAIHRAAGPDLKEACKELNGAETGEAKLTPGFDLPAEYVIHTVGPVYRDGESGEPEKLEACYKNSLKRANEKELKTLAFPAISTGIYGYPLEEASSIAVKTLRKEGGKDTTVETVYLVAFDDKTEKALKESLEGKKGEKQ